MSMEFSRQEYWSGLLFPSQGDLPNPGIKPKSPALAGGFFTAKPPGNPVLSICVCVHAKSLQLCQTLCDPMHCSPPGPSVHGISQARILEWVAISLTRGSSQLKDGNRVSCIAGSLHQMSYPGKSLLSYSELITFS